MPGYDRTGPRGMGPATGWGRGYCTAGTGRGQGARGMGRGAGGGFAAGAEYGAPGYGGFGRGWRARPFGGGFGRGRGFCRNWGPYAGPAPLVGEPSREELQWYADNLEASLQNVRAEIAEREKREVRAEE